MRTKKLLSITMALALAFVAVGSFGITNTVNAAENETLMYRMYNPNSGEHFYTSSSAERDNLINATWHYEGYGFVTSSGGDPVYRLYNPNSGEHHYTLNVDEKDYLDSIGWNYEGIGWYSQNTGDACEKKTYRLYNPNATGQYEAGAHHYTLDESEKNYLVSIGWNYEGTSFTSTHDLLNNNDIVEGTCVSEGYSGGAKCKHCGKTYDGTTLPINPNNHVHKTEEMSPATEIYSHSFWRCNMTGEIIYDSDDHPGDAIYSNTCFINHFNNVHGTDFTIENVNLYTGDEQHRDYYNYLCDTDAREDHTEFEILKGYLFSWCCDDCGACGDGYIPVQ